MTRAIAFILFTMSLLTVAASQLLFKARLTLLGETVDSSRPMLASISRTLADPWLWAAALLVATGAACWYLAMIKLPLGFMLPLASMIAPFVTIGAWLFLNEGLTPPKLAAVAVIALGAAWLGWLNA